MHHTTMVEYMGHFLASIVRLGVRLDRADAAFKFAGLNLGMCRTRIRGNEGM